MRDDKYLQYLAIFISSFTLTTVLMLLGTALVWAVSR